MTLNGSAGMSGQNETQVDQRYRRIRKLVEHHASAGNELAESTRQALGRYSGGSEPAAVAALSLALDDFEAFIWDQGFSRGIPPEDKRRLSVIKRHDEQGDPKAREVVTLLFEWMRGDDPHAYTKLLEAIRDYVPDIEAHLVAKQDRERNDRPRFEVRSLDDDGPSVEP